MFRAEIIKRVQVEGKTIINFQQVINRNGIITNDWFLEIEAYTVSYGFLECLNKIANNNGFYLDVIDRANSDCLTLWFYPFE